MTTMAVNVLPMDPISNNVSCRTGRPLATSASPYDPVDQQCRRGSVTARARPGIEPSARQRATSPSMTAIAASSDPDAEDRAGMLAMMAAWKPPGAADARRRATRTARAVRTGPPRPSIDAIDRRPRRFPDRRHATPIDGGAATCQVPGAHRPRRPDRRGRRDGHDAVRRPGSSSAIRPRSGTSPTPMSSVGSSAATSRPVRRSC